MIETVANQARRRGRGDARGEEIDEMGVIGEERGRERKEGKGNARSSDVSPLSEKPSRGPPILLSGNQ